MLVLGVGRGAIWQIFDHDAVTRSLFLSLPMEATVRPILWPKASSRRDDRLTHLEPQAQSQWIRLNLDKELLNGRPSYA